MSQKVSVVIEKDEHGYYAYCPELEGCQTQGDSIEEVMENIKEAIELYLETLSEDEIKRMVKDAEENKNIDLMIFSECFQVKICYIGRFRIFNKLKGCETGKGAKIPNKVRLVIIAVVYNSIIVQCRRLFAQFFYIGFKS